MHPSQHASSGSLQRISTPVPVPLQRAPLDRRHRDQIFGLRQVEEFSTKLEKIRRTGYFSAIVLLLFTFICVFLFLHKFDIISLYSAGVVVMLIQLAMAGTDYYHEERRAAQAYWNYLDTYSYNVIMELRQTSQLSDWSRHEIDKYLAVTHLKW